MHTNQTNLQIVNQLYDAFSRKDIQGMSSGGYRLYEMQGHKDREDL